MVKPSTAKKVHLVPIPWESCKAETLRAICRDFGAPTSTRTVDAMRQFLTVVQYEGLEYAKQQASDAVDVASTNRGGAKRKDISGDGDDIVSVDQAEESASAAPSRRVKRPRTQDAEPDPAESTSTASRRRTTVSEEEAAPALTRTRGRSAKAVGEDHTRGRGRKGTEPEEGEKEAAPVTRERSGKSAKTTDDASAPIGHNRSRPTKSRTVSAGRQTRATSRSAGILKDGARRTRKLSTRAANAASAAAKSGDETKKRQRDRTKFRSGARGKRHQDEDEEEEDEDEGDEEESDDEGMRTKGTFEGVVLRPFFKPDSSRTTRASQNAAEIEPTSEPNVVSTSPPVTSDVANENEGALEGKQAETVPLSNMILNLSTSERAQPALSLDESSVQMDMEAPLIPSNEIPPPITPDEPETPPHMPPSPKKPKPSSFTALAAASTDNSSIGGDMDADVDASAESDEVVGADEPTEMPRTPEANEQQELTTTEVVEVTKEIELELSPAVAESVLRSMALNLHEETANGPSIGSLTGDDIEHLDADRTIAEVQHLIDMASKFAAEPAAEDSVTGDPVSGLVDLSSGPIPGPNDVYALENPSASEAAIVNELQQPLPSEASSTQPKPASVPSHDLASGSNSLPTPS